MKDVNYFIVQASRCTQREFELDFADVIEVYDTSSVTLTTEDGKSLQITYDERGCFKSYFVDVQLLPFQMSQSNLVKERVEQVIDTLRELTWKGESVDGETMQYILEKVGMTDQMLRQLVMNNPYTDTSDLLEEKVRLSDQHLRSLAKNN